MFQRATLLIALVVSVAVASVSPGGQTSVSSISGVVKDPQGVIVSGVIVTAAGEGSQPRLATTDEQGTFKFDNLNPGRYVISVEGKGFKRAEEKVTLEAGRPARIEIKLEVAAPKEELTVPGKGGVAPNSDPGYRQVRDQTSFETYSVTNLTIKRDVGTINLRSGLISFAAPTMGRVVKAVFTGDGQFSLMPAVPIERSYLKGITETDSVDESFEKAVFCFSDKTYDEIKRQAASAGADPRAGDILGDFNNHVRRRAERSRSFVEALISSNGENLDAELLGDIYNPKRSGSFNAFIVGKKYNDLRFFVRPHGALPQILSPEEVALVNLDPGNEREGVWYLAHYESEYHNGTASSEEDKRIIDVQHYAIETVIGRDERLTATAAITFKAMGDGDRVIPFGLLPTLRVNRVTMSEQEIGFIQEPRKDDASFYVILPKAMIKDQQYSISVEYHGDKVVEDEGGGNFAVGARTSWYPSANAFNDRATVDLTFKVPKQYTLVGVGKLVKEWKEGDYAASQWVSEVPLAVAGFNYGSFKKKAITDQTTKYVVEGYATSELPSYLREVPTIQSRPDDQGDPGQLSGNVTPSRLIDRGIAEAQNSVRIFTKYFGEAPYGRIAITQQPQANFGQSWPTLVYLPILAFYDSTQRYMLFRGINKGFSDFIAEVTPHEVSHQWWGHIVGWASYHDQWLSEGFADFSAGLYLQFTEPKPDKYLHYWQQHHEQILRKNNWGRRANDAGPLWMGLRLNTYKTLGAYQSIVYPKGGYILHMLRSLMWENKTGDQRFIEMMRDFVKTYFNQNASTEGFKKVLERHMTPGMDLEGNHRMDWFFNEWVYGTEVPSYKFQYSFLQDAGGATVLKGTITQSGVTDNFKMLVPIYLDFDGKIMRLGEAALTGNTTTQEFSVKLPKKPKRAMINAYNDILAVDVVNEQRN